MKHIWLVSEGSPGHLSQSEGLAHAVGSVIPCRIDVISGRSKVRGFMRPMVIGLMRLFGMRLPHCLRKFVADVDDLSGLQKPDLVISSGGKSVFAARCLATDKRTPYLFIGVRKPFPAEWFDMLVSPETGEPHPNLLQVDVVPTLITRKKLDELAPSEARVWCMIIGGDTKSNRYRSEDWISLSKAMNALSARYGIRWLLTSSRRTGVEVEQIIRSQLNPDAIKDAIWWSEGRRRPVAHFMARAEVLAVTQDSITMLSEAANSGRKVVAVAPSQNFFMQGSFMESYVRRLESKNRVTCAVFDELGSLDINGLKEAHETPESDMVKMASEVIRYFWS